MASYLAAQVSGLTLGATGNVFAVPFPERAPNQSVQIIEYGSLPSTRGFGASATAPLVENVRFQVTVRDILNSYNTARDLAHSCYETLDHLADTTITSTTGGSTRYIYLQAMPPIYIGTDENDRHLFTINVECQKDRG